MIKEIAEISSWFLNWIKKVFYSHSKGKKDYTVPLPKHEDKKNEQDREGQHKLPEVSEIPKASGIAGTAGDQEKIREGERDKGPQKPYSKKSPTERDKEETRKTPIHAGKQEEPEQKKTIYLGNFRKRKLTLPPPPTSGRDVTKKEEPEKEYPPKFASIESPFIEIDLDRAEVYLILPRQRLNTFEMEKVPSSIYYKVELNEKLQNNLTSIVTTDIDGNILTEEKRILIENPLKKIKVVYPAEIEERVFNYNHNDDAIYMFAAIGNNRGRMIYLFDENGKINPLSKKDMWLLIRENFELQSQPDVIEERWFWDNYRPYLTNLGKLHNLEIMETTSGKTRNFPIEPAFFIEGDQLVEDDFKKGCPLFSGKNLKIIAPHENSSGWNVWIQNKAAGFKIKENWNGAEPLILSLPQDLPCDCGEFQIDICQEDMRIPEETQFFRWIPNIELDWSKKLIIPNGSCDMPSSINIKLDSNIEWELKVESSEHIENIVGTNYKLLLPPEKDTLKFSIAKAGMPETITNIQITFPRIKWKASKQNNWDWRPQEIQRRDMKIGEPFYLLVKTNDIESDYDLEAILEKEGHSVQHIRFDKKGMEYTLDLNRFYDTIRHFKSELILKVAIYQDIQFIGKVNILNIPSLIIRCIDKSCSLSTYRIEDIWSHFGERHFKSFIEHLSYEELREYDNTLPYKIYQCPHCDEYIPAINSLNPTSAILRHVEKKHNIKMSPSFKVIFNIDVIRERVYPNLREIYKCKICKKHFQEHTEEQQVKHFVDQHSNEVFEYLED